eukprot:NODE_3695_length_1303_cov_55.137288_g3232_i0.p1 GENE.NODE_3695_length_1303_cov_55.137288_g3232_i0~~NODE_3695_length_1303_cov_55.137288_g3232_i0.p1  ORF type:complete len:379 (-),score=36.31 NODE_3695_length_1303_cov_55.137288_g3232_i0:109-1245(-)
MSEVSKLLLLAEQIERSVDEQKNSLKQKTQTHSQSLSWAEEINAMQSDIICIKNRGVPFHTSSSTLRSVPSSMLSTMFSGKYKVDVNDDGYVELDRDPDIFGSVILSYLRDGSRFIPKSTELQENIVDEVSFFGLESVLCCSQTSFFDILRVAVTAPDNPYIVICKAVNDRLSPILPKPKKPENLVATSSNRSTCSSRSSISSRGVGSCHESPESGLMMPPSTSSTPSGSICSLEPYEAYISHQIQDSYRCAGLCLSRAYVSGQHSWYIRLLTDCPHLYVGFAHSIGLQGNYFTQKYYFLDTQEGGTVSQETLWCQYTTVDLSTKGVVLGMHLDMDNGIIYFSKDRENLGIAFEGCLPCPIHPAFEGGEPGHSFQVLW